MPRKRILILTADVGFGHRRAAQAIEAALLELYGDQVEPVVVNPLHAANAPDIIRQIEAGYDDIVMDDSPLYRIVYQATDAPVVSDIVDAVTTSLLNDTMLSLIREHKPSAVVTTHPTFAHPAANAIKDADHEAPLATVITDLTDVHYLWFSPAATMHFVPTPEIRRQALAARIPATRVRVTGMPVHPAFARENRAPHDLRSELGWQPDIPSALVVASARTRQMATIVRLLDRAGMGLQLAVVTGGVSELQAALSEERWQSPVHVYGRVDNIPQMMKAADFVVSKAGGLIVSEALACGLPMIVSEALPGQEMGNARYLVDGGAGAWAPGAVQVVATAFSWLQNGKAQLDTARVRASELGKPRAVYDMAEAIWSIA